MATYLVQAVREDLLREDGVNAAIVTRVATEAEAKEKVAARVGPPVRHGDGCPRRRARSTKATRISTTDLELVTENDGVLLVQGKILANGVKARGA